MSKTIKQHKRNAVSVRANLNEQSNSFKSLHFNSFSTMNRTKYGLHSGEPYWRNDNTTIHAPRNVDNEWTLQVNKRRKRRLLKDSVSGDKNALMNNVVGRIILSDQKNQPNVKAGKNRPSVKRSSGIACMRKNPNNGKLEVIVIKKRYSYAYAEFMKGSYYPADFKKGSGSEARLIDLFSEMTVEDKIIILSMNFSSMWYHIWLNRNKSQQYYMIKSRFESAFKADNGRRLGEMISASNNGRHMWEIPKGRMNYDNEGDVRCAVREFEEETGIEKSCYTIYPNTKRVHKYVDKGVKYEMVYFLAFTIKNDDNSVSIIRREQFSEVGDIKWMNIDMIRAVDCGKKLENIVSPLMNVMKKKIKRR